jgi:hypothetical protein
MRDIMVYYNHKKKRLLTNKSTYMHTPKQTVALTLSPLHIISDCKHFPAIVKYAQII